MPHHSLRYILLLLVGAMLNATTSQAQADDPLLFISAFEAGEKGAIHAFHLDTATGQLKAVHSTTGVEHPFFFAVSKDHKYLYSIHAKTFSGADPEEVAAYALEGRTGKMKLLNRQSTRGTASCYVDVDPTGKTVVVANYTTGSVAALPAPGPPGRPG